LKSRSSFKIFEKALIPFLGAVLFFSSFAKAEIGEAFILCKHDKIVRTLRVDQPSSESRCKAVYTKRGVDQVIGSSQNKTSCEGFLSQVRKNLEQASWNCREVKESRVSDLSGDETP
jgi:hypothetical protein